MFLGKSDSALRYSERSVSVAPSEAQWRRTLSSLYALAGRYDDGVRECSTSFGLSNTCAITMGLLAGVPRTREAGLAIIGARDRLPRALGAPAWTAMVYARLGMADSMFSRLSIAIARRDDAFTHLITSPDFARYHADPRWDAIVGEARRR
jgi:hypothetical protein